jgi:hypothetical protein
MAAAESSTAGAVWDRTSTDRRIAFEKGRAEVAKLEAEVEQLREDLNSDVQSRRLRYPVAIAALIVMVLQVTASNAIFGWYGDANAWNIPALAISVWLGATVVEVIGVALVVVNYLFPAERREYA